MSRTIPMHSSQVIIPMFKSCAQLMPKIYSNDTQHLNEPVEFTHQDIIKIFYHFKKHTSPNECIRLNLNQRRIYYQYPTGLMDGDRSLEFGHMHMVGESQLTDDDSIFESDDETMTNDSIWSDLPYPINDPIEEFDNTSFASTLYWDQINNLNHQSKINLDQHRTNVVEETVQPNDIHKHQPQNQLRFRALVKVYFEDDGSLLHQWWPTERSEVIQSLNQLMKHKDIVFQESKRQSCFVHLKNLIIPSSHTRYQPKLLKRKNRRQYPIVGEF